MLPSRSVLRPVGVHFELLVVSASCWLSFKLITGGYNAISWWVYTLVKGLWVGRFIHFFTDREIREMRTALWGLAAGVSLWGSVAMGAATVPVTTLPWGTAAFVQDPNQPIIYATVPTLNSVAVIDSNTLAVKATIGIGSNPRGLTLSPDGSRLYVANSGSNFVGVIDTATRQARRRSRFRRVARRACSTARMAGFGC